MAALIVLAFCLPVLVPLLFLLSFIDKSSSRYRTWWWWFACTLAVVCVVAFMYVMCTPFYSSRRGGVSNPGGPSGSLLLGMLFLIFVPSFVIPSFPALFLLGCFPPKSYSREKRRKIQKIVPIGVVVLALLILIKHHAYMKDYRDYRNPSYTPAELEEARLQKLEKQKELLANESYWKQRKKWQKEREEQEKRKEEEERARIEAMSETERAEWEMLQRKWEENAKKKKAERAERDTKRRAEIAEQRIEKWRANLDD